MIVAYMDGNDCDFGVKVAEGTNVEMLKMLIKGGVEAWYAAADTPVEETDFFTAEEVEGFYYLGYAEPTSMLLTRCGIEHEIVDLEFDSEGNAICDEIVD